MFHRLDRHVDNVPSAFCDCAGKVAGWVVRGVVAAATTAVPAVAGTSGVLGAVSASTAANSGLSKHDLQIRGVPVIRHGAASADLAYTSAWRGILLRATSLAVGRVYSRTRAESGSRRS